MNGAMNKILIHHMKNQIEQGRIESKRMEIPLEMENWIGQNKELQKGGIHRAIENRIEKRIKKKNDMKKLKREMKNRNRILI